MSSARDWYERFGGPRHKARFERMGPPQGLSEELPGDPYEEPDVVPPPWLTWGQQQNLDLSVVGSEASAPAAGTTQLLYVKVKMPTTWHLRVTFDFFFPSGISPTNPITVQYQYTHGVGMASVTVQRSFTVTPNATTGAFSQIVDDQIFPADAINLSAQLVAGYTPGVSMNGSIQVTALAAPEVV